MDNLFFLVGESTERGGLTELDIFSLRASTMIYL